MTNNTTIAVKATDIKPKNSFVIKDIDNRQTTVKFEEGIVSVKRVIQPVIIFYIFTPWCAPCRGVLPYLSMLQRSEKDNIFIIGLIAHEHIDNNKLRNFMKRYDATFFISNSSDNDKLINTVIKELSFSQNYPIPLTVIYNKGKLVTDIEGAVPYEMLKTIINELKQGDAK